MSPEMAEMPFSENEVDCDTQRAKNPTIWNLFVVKDLFFLRRDSLIFFTDTVGNPLDYGAKILQKCNKFPFLKNPELNVPCPIRHNNIYDYAIPNKGTTSLNLAEVKTNITLALTKLREILVEKAVPRVAISRSLKIENLAWPEIFDILKKTLANIETKIFICLNIIKYPLESEKQKIIEGKIRLFSRKGTSWT